MIPKEFCCRSFFFHLMIFYFGAPYSPFIPSIIISVVISFIPSQESCGSFFERLLLLFFFHSRFLSLSFSFSIGKGQLCKSSDDERGNIDGDLPFRTSYFFLFLLLFPFIASRLDNYRARNILIVALTM